MRRQYIGDVTALSTCSLLGGTEESISLCLAGMGPALHVYDLLSSCDTCLLTHHVFDGARIYGFAFSDDVNDQSKEILVFGDRFLTVSTLSNVSEEQMHFAVDPTGALRHPKERASRGSPDGRHLFSALDPRRSVASKK